MKRIFTLFFCIIALALLTTSCYTTNKCPAYGHYTEVVKSEE